MSVFDFLALRRRIFAEVAPECWGLLGNSVFGRAESWTLLALFDTEEQAVAYREASRLPESFRTKNGISRTFRPDSLLWDYNEMLGGGIGLITTSILDSKIRFEEAPINPEPPSAPLEEVLAPHKAEAVAEALA